ncbi:hypothetical protein PIROE2DRAFT_18501 [Piromyces sp. E2]|nr:hypothetical protein PIROE2DRAFT_18501 [Piromyces sp. E2]|eukprot:OUM56757.1 hypothetical protein PIROE2DRAFT_18501 [Piromyces sp. E2]
MWKKKTKRFIFVSNENEFKKAINSNYSEIILESSIDLNESIILNSLNFNLIITGKTKNEILSFNNDIEKDGFFLKNVNNVEFSNLTLVGNLNLNNSINLSISNVNFFGLINSKNSNIVLKKTSYYYLQNKPSPFGIYLDQSNITIEESSLYGSDSISEYIIYLTETEPINQINHKNNNEYLNKILINHSYLSGQYKSGIIKVDVASNINIQSSHLTNASVMGSGLVV